MKHAMHGAIYFIRSYNTLTRLAFAVEELVFQL